MLALSESQLDALSVPVHGNMRRKLLAELEPQGAIDDLSGPEPAIAIPDRDTDRKNRLLFRPDGLPRRVESAAGRGYELDYDKRGLLTGITIPSREPYRFEYATDVTLKGASQGDARYRFTQDQRGEIASVAWPDSRTMRFERHSNGKLKQFTDRAAASTEYAYDDLFRLTAITGPLGKKLEFVREPEQNRFTLVYPNGARESVEWVQGTPRFHRKLPDGTPIEYSLDEKSRVVGIDWPGGESARFTYTAGGELESVRRGADFVRFRRDSNGHLAAEETPRGDVLTAHSKEGRLLRLVTPFGDTISYTYDADGFLTSISGWNRVIRFTPGPDGQFTEIDYGGGLVERRRYGAAGRMVEVQVSGSSAGLLSRQSYKYDACERLIELQDHDRLHGSLRRFSYDAEDRLVADESPRFNARYKYDARGNMVQATAGVERDVVQFGDMDEPVRFNAKPLKYDARGNLIECDSARGPMKCAYDQRGMMTRCSVGNRIIEFEYDALGRRTKKRSGIGTWRFGWFGLQLLWEEFTPLAGASVRRDYLYVPGTFAAVAFRENGAVYWLQNDTRGAVIRAFDEKQELVWQGNYESFGAVQAYGKRVRQSLRLVGQYEDEETGLHYNTARYYSPGIRSFLAKDPRWHCTLATNYGYARCDPWNKADPTGGLPGFLSRGLNSAAHMLSSAEAAVSAAGSMLMSVAANAIKAIPCIPCAILAAMRFVSDVVNGFVNALGSDQMFGAFRQKPKTTAYRIGQMLGDAAALIGGGLEFLGGAGLVTGGTAMEGVGIFATATGVFAEAGIPTAMAGAAVQTGGVVVAGVGVATAGTALHNLAMSTSDSGGAGGGSEVDQSAPTKSSNDADAEQITNGHAYGKHKDEFGSPSKEQFKDLVKDTMDNGQSKSLAKGRTGYWSDKNDMVVIKDPASPDGGTAFRPKTGINYFKNLK